VVAEIDTCCIGVDIHTVHLSRVIGMADFADPVRSCARRVGVVSHEPRVASVAGDLVKLIACPSPGSRPFDGSGVVIVSLTLLMLFVSPEMWQVKHTNSPYLPPVTPQPPANGHFAEFVVMEL